MGESQVIEIPEYLKNKLPRTTINLYGDPRCPNCFGGSIHRVRRGTSGPFRLEVCSKALIEIVEVRGSGEGNNQTAYSKEDNHE